MPNLSRPIMVEDQFGQTSYTITDAGDNGSTTLDRTVVYATLTATNTQTVVFPWVPTECPGKEFAIWFVSVAANKAVTVKDAAGATIGSSAGGEGGTTLIGFAFKAIGPRWWTISTVAD